MKRFLCILMCLLLAAPAALAADYTPTELFHQQFIIGGNGLRGTLNLSVSGVAPWVEVLSPFTAAPLQVRIIGEQQGDVSAMVADDDDWQIKLFAKDAAGEQQGTTWLYGNPEAIYLQSEMLPDWLLMLPVENVHLPYQLADGHFAALLSAFGLAMAEEDGGNTEIYSALTKLMQIDESAWDAEWAPVMEKYYTEMDMWLSGYAEAPVLSGSTGSMTMRTSYSIPANELKAQTKYIIGLMIYDYDLQELLVPYFTEEQRSLYLNPALIYVYDYVIDAAPLSGSVILEREMTVMGETTGMTISLPLPRLPETVTAPVGDMLTDLFGLPYTGLLSGLERISFSQSDNSFSISVTSPARTISFIVDETVENAESVKWNGFLRITPAVGSDEPQMAAAFTYQSSHRIWEDEEYNTHEEFSLTASVEPDASLVTEDDPFRSSYVDFEPVSVSGEVGFLKSYQKNAPVKVDVRLGFVLPDATLDLTLDTKIAVKWALEELPTKDADSIMTLTPERMQELLTLLTNNAIRVMTNLNVQPADEAAATDNMSAQ